jgi:putative ABC transport system permease protein
VSGRRRGVVRLRASDIARLGAAGLRTRPARVVLSALGIAIGIGAMIAVVGISASSHAQLDRTLSRLGTNLLQVKPGATLSGEPVQLPAESVAMLARIAPVESVAATGLLDAHVYRNDHVPLGETSSVDVVAVDRDLPGTLRFTVARGSWLTPATAAYPAVVLGARASQRLDIRGPGVRVWLAGQWYAVVGVLDPVELAPELDSSALIGWPAAQTYARFDGHPTTIYVRAAESQLGEVRGVLGATANPQAAHEVAISRPSDALAAKQATDAALRSLLLALGAVALLVGGIGVANTMVISVLERRGEIGLRRSLGATRGHVRVQFLTESLLLSAIGGLGGVLIGVAVTSAYATNRGWPAVVPPWASLGGLGATLAIGVLAGLYPAMRASRVAPAAALAG